MIELGLQRISRLLYDTPLRWRAIHVAGTNGKGSTCAYISAMLQAYNCSDYRLKSGHNALRHGRFTSPHLVDRWDGISISCERGSQVEPVSSELFHTIEKSVLTRSQEENVQATEFELLTATAFEIFNQSHLDVAVIEVGVGGRLDSTNILGQPLFDDNGSPRSVDVAEHRPAPLVSAIAKIGMDHQGLLGDTIEAIAREKAGIIKPGVPLVFDSSNELRVQSVLESIARQKESPVINSNTVNFPDIAQGWAVHTRQNMGVAFLATWTALTSLGRIASSASSSEECANQLRNLQSTMFNAAAHTVFPGRQEWIDISSLTGRQGPALLDGAHNPQSANVLAEKVRELRLPTDTGSNEMCHGGDPVTWVVAVSMGKPLKEFWEPLLRAGDNVFAVEFGPVDGMPWVQPTPASEVADSARAVAPALGTTHSYGRDIAGALRAASASSKMAAGSNLVIAGSLYLVGDVHRLLRETQG